MRAVIGVHEMHGRMHPNYWQITILLVVDLCSSLAYFMMTQPLPIAGKLPINMPGSTEWHKRHPIARQNRYHYLEGAIGQAHGNYDSHAWSAWISLCKNLEHYSYYN